MSPLYLVVIIPIAFAAGVAWGRRGRASARRIGLTGSLPPQTPQAPPSGFNFTSEVRSTLSRSRKEAGLLGNQYVGPEHILLGLIHANSGTAARVLERLHIDPATLRTSMLEVVQRGEPHESPDLPYTARAKRVLERAMIAARDLGHDYVGLEHMLLALAQDDGSVGRILTSAGADAQAVRRETLAVLSTDPNRGSAPPAT